MQAKLMIIHIISLATLNQEIKHNLIEKVKLIIKLQLCLSQKDKLLK